MASGRIPTRNSSLSRRTLRQSTRYHGRSRQICCVKYDSLIIASGTSFTSPLWSVSAGSERLSAALRDFHEHLPGSSSVLVAGGGPAGVETAGELGETYGGKKRSRSCRAVVNYCLDSKTPTLGRTQSTALPGWVSRPSTTASKWSLSHHRTHRLF